MLRKMWNWIVGRETQREQGSREERRLASESFEDYAAEEFVGERLGGHDPERLETDEPPRI